MRSPDKTWEVLSALAANAVPLGGVLVFGWSALPTILLYWIENEVLAFIGLRTIAELSLVLHSL